MSTTTDQARKAEALREALRTADMLGFGADVDADSIIEEAARGRLDEIAPDEYAAGPGASNPPTAEVIADEEEPDAWHINVNLPWAGTKVFVSVAEHSDDDNRYTDLTIHDGTVLVLSATSS